MNLDDIIYLSLLIFSICFGYYYRQIKEKEQKKLIGTSVGLFIIFVVSGFHILHNIVFAATNALIILFVGKCHIHVVSFIFSFSYLIFFRTTVYFGIPYPPAHTNLVQMILTLKLVGLAFEINQNYISKPENTDKTVEEKAKCEYQEVNPGFIDILHYSFNYIGVLTGPYYKYKTFDDYFNLPFSRYAKWKDVTISKLQYVPMYAVLFLVATYYWPLSYALSDEFYNDRSWLYRFWYIWPNFFIFRMRIYIGLVLSECVCTMAGFGAYPTITASKPGMGPSSNYQEINKIAKDVELASKSEYDFETIHNINPYGADFVLTCREGMKNWNMCVQYWLAVYIYKRIPIKQFRTAITMFVSAVWHGVYSGYYICICSVPFYLVVEDLYVKLFIKENQGISRKIWEWIIWFLKMHYFSYFAIAFHLLEVHKILHYYNSIYHAGWIMAGFMYLVGMYILKTRKRDEKKVQRVKEESKIQ